MMLENEIIKNEFYRNTSTTEIQFVKEIPANTETASTSRIFPKEECNDT